jgi:hypothetical protein
VTGCNRAQFDRAMCSYHYLRTYGGAPTNPHNLWAPSDSVFANLATRGQADIANPPPSSSQTQTQTNHQPQ